MQRFEYTWELAWKLIADYLAFDGMVLSTKGPRPVLKAAYEAGYIDHGPKWMRALDALNARFGRGTVTYASMGRQPGWKLRTDFISPRYTTVWDDLLTV